MLTGVHALAFLIAGWLAATQARLGMLDEARSTLLGVSGEASQMGAVCNARAVMGLMEENPAAALDELRGVLDLTPGVVPALTLVESHLLAGVAHLALGDRSAAAAAAEEALAAAETDRLVFPFAMTNAAGLLDVIPRHATAHRALLADITDLLRGERPSQSIDRAQLSEPTELSRSELRVLRYLPTNLTRPEIAKELYVSINTVNTHVRNIYSKLGAGDRSSAVRRARELRIIASGRSRS